MTHYLVPALCFAGGFLLGGIVFWLRGRRWYDRAVAAGETESARRSTQIELQDRSLLELKNSLNAKEGEVERLHDENTRLQVAAGQLETTLEEQRRRNEEQRQVLEEAKEQFSDAFKALAADALQSNSQSFLTLAKESLDGSQQQAQQDLDHRKQAINELVEPVKKSLETLDKQLRDLEVKRVGAYQGLSQQVQSLLSAENHLRHETSRLARAMSTPGVRGRWGELQLRRVIELTGMSEHCDFVEQQSVATENGARCPDLLVRLPGRKLIVIDSKAPLSKYFEALEATDEPTRTAHLTEHARAVHTHLASLSRKAYFEQFEAAPEFVVLFLPGEAFFSAALQHDPSLIESGAEQKVILASPTTLIALLLAVAHGWRQELLAENARQISGLGRELYDRLTKMTTYLAELGKKLNGAVSSYNDAVGSFEKRVLISARKFPELGVSGKEIPLLTSIEQHARQPQVPAIRGRMELD